MGYGQPDGTDYLSHIERIRADKVWEDLDHYGYGPNGWPWISVIDFGFSNRYDYSNPDPYGQYLWFRRVYTYDHADNPSGLEAWEITDSNGNLGWHGTYVGSLIAADHEHPVEVVGKPVVGVAPQSILIASNIWLDGTDKQLDWTYVEKALNRARINYVDVVNLSIGNCGADMPQSVEDQLDALKTMTTRLGSYGAVIVASAGNGMWNNRCETQAIHNPAAYPGVVGVGAVDDNDEPLSLDDTYNFSYGSQMDIVAPGKGIWSSANVDTTYSAGLSYGGGTYPDGTPALTGTSFSAPQVAGAVALIRSLNPSWSANEVKEALFATAVDLSGTGYGTGWDEHTGHGIVDAYAAATYQFPLEITPIYGPSNITSAGYYTWSVTASNGTPPYSYSWKKESFPAGTDSSVTFYVDSFDEPSFTLSVEVIDADGTTLSDFDYVFVSISGGGIEPY